MITKTYCPAFGIVSSLKARRLNSSTHRALTLKSLHLHHSTAHALTIMLTKVPDSINRWSKHSCNIPAEYISNSRIGLELFPSLSVHRVVAQAVEEGIRCMKQSVKQFRNTGIGPA